MASAADRGARNTLKARGGAGRANGGVSPLGVTSTGGNAWEWVSSQYQPYPYDAKDGREGSKGDVLRSQRGGSWDYSDVDMRCALRGSQDPGTAFDEDGFRVASSGS